MAGPSLGVFLLTDIVGSTRLWAEHPDHMGPDLAVHDDVIRAALAEHRGTPFSTAGDSFAAAFASVDDAVAAAVAAQRALAATRWQVSGGIAVRMAVHLGAAQRRGDGWYGPPLNETARVMAAAHGGQILVSEPAAALLRGVQVIDLGEHRLRDLDGTLRLFQVATPGLANDFPPLRSMESYVTTLPVQRTSLIGRDDVVARIRRLLAAHRLVTLLGPGGAGKTRLAVEAAGRELGHFPGGVFFVDLTKASGDADVAEAVISGIGSSVPPDQPPEEHLAKYLADRTAMLVVDNCEHVIDGVAEVVDELLMVAPRLSVLATSREPLDLEGEQRLPVPSLDATGPSSAAVRLFTERALAADSTFVLDDATLKTVTEITRRLDGMPLAIELAAARAGILSPDQILSHLNDRFRLLSRGRRRAPLRQRTLEGAIDWSYELLDPDEQRAFRLVAICAGPFSLPTAARLLGRDELEAAEHLDSLATKSLIIPIRFGGPIRGYQLLETLRDYGRRKLSDAGELEPARQALESALVPPEWLLDDWTWLVNEYLVGGPETIVVEGTTRRDAALHALESGALDAAALIFSSCVFQDDPATLETTLRVVSPLAGQRDQLGPSAWRAAAAAKVALERLTRRHLACLETAGSVLDLLDSDDPARPWFDLWRCAYTTAVAPEMGIVEIDKLLPVALDHARPPHDWTVSQLLSSKATGLALRHQLDQARDTAGEARSRAPTGTEAHDQALALLLWILYLNGAPSDPTLQDAASAQNQLLGLAEFCAAPAALCGPGSLEQRASRLITLARRRPAADTVTPFLLAFAWLAIERGDERDGDAAEQLIGAAELYDGSTAIAIVHTLAALRGWSEESWEAERDAAIAELVGSDHEAVAKQGPAVLAQELHRWEGRLTRSPTVTLPAS